jgi:hypothetical protein
MRHSLTEMTMAFGRRRVKSEGAFHLITRNEGTGEGQGVRGINVQLYSFFNVGSRWEWVANATP